MSASQLELVEQDRDAAFALLRLLIREHPYVKRCASNAGLACYSCRTVEWLEAHSDYKHQDDSAADPRDGRQGKEPR